MKSLIKLGDAEYGAWTVPQDAIRLGAICYCAGVGENAKFDLALIERGCEVFAFDPTPRAIAYAESVKALEPRYKFLPVGIADTNETRRFYYPNNPEWVSCSVEQSGQSDKYFDAECKTIPAIMAELGHDHIDILKLDIEGCEPGVLRQIMHQKIRVGVICVEFHAMRIRHQLLWKARLWLHGYRVAVHEGAADYTFVRRRPLSSNIPARSQ